MSRDNKVFDKKVDRLIMDKSKATEKYRNYILNKLMQMFEYENLPDSIPPDIFDQFLFENGNLWWEYVKGEHYVFTGGKGGVPDVYNRPTTYTFANPALALSKTSTIGVDGVMIRNDTYQEGLLPLIDKFAMLLTETTISMHSNIINSRDINAISAGDDRSYKGATEYLRLIKNGETGVIAESQLLDGVRRHPTSENSNMNQLREQYQFLESKLYAELGINSQHNMKRQYISDEENLSGEDLLLPLIDNMLLCRERGLDEVNEMYDLNVQVKLRGTWELKFEELATAIERAEEGYIEEDGYGEEQESTETVESITEEPSEEIREEPAEEPTEEPTEEEPTEEDPTEEDPIEEGTDEEGTTEEESTEEEPAEEEQVDEEPVDEETVDEEPEVNIEINIANDDSEIIIDDEEQVDDEEPVEEEQEEEEQEEEEEEIEEEEREDDVDE